MNKDLSTILVNPKKNSKGDHYICDCPYCGRERHFYINIFKSQQKNSEGKYIKCWDCKKCNETGNLPDLLKFIGEEDFLEGEYTNVEKLEKRLSIEINIKKITDEDLVLPNKKLPIGFIRQANNQYLRERGFSDFHFRFYKCGITKALLKFENFVIIAVEESGDCKGYLCRSVYDKDVIERKNEKLKLINEREILRWQNSKFTDFSKLLFGFDEIGFNTTTAILVEGIFHKVSVDNRFILFNNDETKCLATFGKSISPYQIYKLKRKGIRNLIIIQDPDAINETKKYTTYLKEEFDSVFVGYAKKDLNEMTYEEIDEVFDNLVSPTEFFYSKIPLISLK